MNNALERLKFQWSVNMYSHRQFHSWCLQFVARERLPLMHDYCVINTLQTYKIEYQHEQGITDRQWHECDCDCICDLRVK